MKEVTIVCALFFLFNVVLSFSSENTIKIIKTNEGYQFFDAGKPVLFYRVKPKSTEKGTYSRANYCHPVL